MISIASSFLCLAAAPRHQIASLDNNEGLMALIWEKQIISLSIQAQRMALTTLKSSVDGFEAL